ncbi:transmembrane protein 69-like [Scleropages formosus]|uniref:Transmembrane protein 69 n=1 Tax=Scleropages formosus TaxID=113540 RepID=A0A0N8JY38_SCLFO|nr:transmembrane protein 69 [Scleropages formosus]XP_018609298.2 transmembrane protein 69 [Scleropages formosus]KPP65457.1 transmembrane protein 69-like [Scleropages formosus]
MISCVARRAIVCLSKANPRSWKSASTMLVCPARAFSWGPQGHSVTLLTSSCLRSHRQTHGVTQPAASRLLRLRGIHCSVPQPQQKRRKTEKPEPQELDLVRYDMKELTKGPKPALYLGFSGLIPFVSAPLIMAVTELYLPDIAYAQVVYGASIVSFLGGARWGFALPEGSPAKPDWMNLANSVVPPLLAWVALLFRDNITEAAMMVIIGLGISLHYDLSLLPTYPSWFKALRTVLTVVATFSLVATLCLKGMYPEKRLKLDD